MGKQLEEYVFWPFVDVFFILTLKVGQGVIPYGANKGIWVGWTNAEEFIGQMIDKVTDRRNV